MTDFIKNPPIPVNKNGVKCGYPNRYNKETDEVEYILAGPMIKISSVSVKVSEYPDNALIYLYRFIKKTNNKIIKDGGEPKNKELINRLVKEFDIRNIKVPNTDLDTKVIMNKSQAMSVSDEKVPSIIKIGQAAEEYELGTTAENIKWEVLTTDEEAEYINNNFDNISIKKL